MVESGDGYSARSRSRYSQKITAAGQPDWIGDRDHQSETCDDTGPNVIVQVVTRPATEQDIDALDRIHQGVTAQGFRPLDHVVDGSYSTPDSIHHSAERWDITLLGPVRDVPKAAERPGLTKKDFRIDWQASTLTCPNGVTSPPWKPTLGDGRSDWGWWPTPVRWAVRTVTVLCSRKAPIGTRPPGRCRQVLHGDGKPTVLLQGN
ncbi:hypothetical protein GQF42_44090 [Streptomyces broussonetiae]|uniref:Transposase n=1 Tax=Streptomyces broussonetiae TaxID=2686304 RepID=A0A6I6NCV3_9ACTN|nr:hypothetical protein [Streptomyces broussonetiae]QHA09244.1 hypothetical protein GQF42_44090 [Streptomyces broussonetiae]